MENGWFKYQNALFSFHAAGQKDAASVRAAPSSRFGGADDAAPRLFAGKAPCPS
jgi:hypothetical protein